MVPSRLFGAIAILALVGGFAMAAQAPTGRAFEVGSVKPNKSGDGQMTLRVQTGGRLIATNMTLGGLIAAAYRTPTGALRSAQIVGGPDWLNRDHFDVDARGQVQPDTSGGPPVLTGEIQEMLRTLLAERFRLIVQRGTQEQPVFDLVLARQDARLGAQLHATHVDCDALRAASYEAFRAGRGAPSGSRLPCAVLGTGTSLSGGDVTMAQLAAGLAAPAGRPVRDHTGLAGTYNVQLSWAAAPAAAATVDPAADVQEGPSLFTAVQEQLGLKLEPPTGPVDVLIIDHADPPTDN